MDNKIGKARVIKEFFGMTAQQAVKEYKELTEQDKSELASAAARALGYSADQCEFEFVAY